MCGSRVPRRLRLGPLMRRMFAGVDMAVDEEIWGRRVDFPDGFSGLEDGPVCFNEPQATGTVFLYHYH